MRGGRNRRAQALSDQAFADALALRVGLTSIKTVPRVRAHTIERVASIA